MKIALLQASFFFQALWWCVKTPVLFCFYFCIGKFSVGANWLQFNLFVCWKIDTFRRRAVLVHTSVSRAGFYSYEPQNYANLVLPTGHLPDMPLIVYHSHHPALLIMTSSTHRCEELRGAWYSRPTPTGPRRGGRE